MRKDHKIAIVLAISALPAGVALMAVPYYAESILKAYSALFFYEGLTLTAIFLLTALIIAFREEASEPPEGYKRRMIALIGMVICGVGFFGFVAAYFWPLAASTPLAESKAIGAPDNLDGTVSFECFFGVGPTRYREDRPIFTGQIIGSPPTSERLPYALSWGFLPPGSGPIDHGASLGVPPEMGKCIITNYG